jgi:imidazolonepropionase-like amidohydrolase
MTFQVSVAFDWPKIIEKEEKYNKKVQLSPYILAGWLLDGTTGPIRKKAIVKTRDRHIVEIRSATAKDLAREDLLDLSNYTLLPGLVDCHVHLSMSGSADPSVRESQLSASFRDAKQMICKHLSMSMLHGVVALRDAGDCRSHALRYKREFWSGNEETPEVKAAGKAWHAPGRYGRLVGRPPYRNCSLARSIAAGQKHVDHVKIVNSGLNSLLDFGKETSPQFNVGDLKKAVRCAHKKGLKVMIHANGRNPVRDAIESGCDSIEHGFFMGTENLKRLADEQITWVPTAFTMEAYARTLHKGSRESQVAKKNLDHQLDQIRQAKRLGVRMALGTDAGSLGVHHGEAVCEEIRLLLVAGLGLGEAVQCATSVGAALLGLEDRAGCLVPGSPATFLAVRAKPERLLETLGSPERVYFKGISVSSLGSEWRRES